MVYFFWIIFIYFFLWKFASYVNYIINYKNDKQDLQEAKEIKQKAFILINENKGFEDIKKIAKKTEHKNYRLKKGKYEIYIKGKYLGRFEKEVEAIEFIKNYKND